MIILLASPLYLTFIAYNIELIPQDLIIIIANSRKDIPLPPFMEIIIMELIIEFLREGGLRLPSIVGQTLGIVGGYYSWTSCHKFWYCKPYNISSHSRNCDLYFFLIPNYEMSLSIRLCRFYMLILAQVLGLFWSNDRTIYNNCLFDELGEFRRTIFFHHLLQ